MMSAQANYRCGDCKASFQGFDEAAECCKAEHVECPISDLPADADLGDGKAYTYGSVFSGVWEIVYNHGAPDQPVRVYPLPALVGRAMTNLFEARYEAGQMDAKTAMRKALGINS